MVNGRQGICSIEEISNEGDWVGGSCLSGRFLSAFGGEKSTIRRTTFAADSSAPLRGDRNDNHFKSFVSTLVGVSFPSTIDLELMAIALMISVIFFMSRVPISSSSW